MEKLRNIKEHPNFARIQNSVEWKQLKKEALLLLGILGGATALAMVPLLAVGGDRVSAKAAGYTVILVLLLLGYIGYYLYRVWELFWYIDRYSFSTALFDKPHQGYKGSMYFTVEVVNRQGKRIKKDTRNIFCQGGPRFEDYLNKQVLVGYNDETDSVVVIQKQN